MLYLINVIFNLPLFNSATVYKAAIGVASIVSAAQGDVRSYCNRAINVFRSQLAQSTSGLGPSRSSNIYSEQRANFAAYSRRSKFSTKGKNKSQSWTMKMVCLHSKDAITVPLSAAEKELLVEAGLGERKVTIDDMSCSPQDFKAAIIATFPKLEDCGGFELLRCQPHRLKTVEPKSAAVVQSPKLLKSVVGNV